MDIHISPHDGVPIYLQIVNQVKYLVGSGRLAAGEELPPIRVLADRVRMGQPLWHEEDRSDYSGLTGAVRPRD